VKNLFKNLPPFAVAIWFSVVAHAVLLAIKFEPELRHAIRRLPSLEVVLINAQTQQAPDNAELIAQANLDRGGNTDDNRQMKTVLPALQRQTSDIKLQDKKEAATAAQSVKRKANKEQEEKRVVELERQSAELLTQLKSDNKVGFNQVKSAMATAVEPDVMQENVRSQKLNRDALLAASLEIDRLEAQIAKQQEAYQKRPRRRFLGARTKTAEDALYLEAWRQKVERVGNMNYPTTVRAQKLYGTLQLTVSIHADGSVEDITIDKSSGSNLLDEAAINIVNLAAPYAKFSDEMRKTTDILGITRTWTFTNEDALHTQ
jgi:periplasmic protein TonB